MSRAARQHRVHKQRLQHAQWDRSDASRSRLCARDPADRRPRPLLLAIASFEMRAYLADARVLTRA